MAKAPQFFIYQGVKILLKNPHKKDGADENYHFSRKSKQLPLLGHSITRTELSDFLGISIELLDRYPKILERIEADLLKHGIEKKKKRLADSALEMSHQGKLPGFEMDVYTEPEYLELETGRPVT